MPGLTFSADQLLSVSEKDKSQLKDIQELLDKLFIRNRNQHRRNHWFKSLWAFRKQLRLLLDAIEHKKKSKASELIEQRLKYWDEECIHQWYL